MQNREAPAFQEYAASLLSNRKYRLMTLTQRGLLHTMRLECWVNQSIPANPDELARYLFVDITELTKALTDDLKSFFKLDNELFTCPELEDYRQHLDDKRQRQSEGGKRGSAITNSKRNTSKWRTNTNDEGNTATNSQAPRRGKDESLVKQSIAKQSQTQPPGNGDLSDADNEWVNELEQAK